MKEMCEAIERIVTRVREQYMIDAVKHVSESFDVSEKVAVEKLGYDLSSYEKAKKNQSMTV